MPHELPPSANWYSSSACDWCESAPSPLVAYAAKNEVRLFDPVAASFRGTLIGHTDRVTTLEFCVGARSAKGGGGGGPSVLCATGSMDQTVRVWDCESLANLHKLSGQHAKEIAGVSACRGGSSVLVSADRGGTVIVWDYSSGKVCKLAPINTGATCVKCGPGGSAAVGFQNGAIIVLDMASAAVLQRLIGHEGDVHALDWAPHADAAAAPASTEVPDSWEDDASDSGGSGGLEGSRGGAASSGILASSSGRDKSIRVWSLVDGSCTQVMKLPRPGNSSKAEVQQPNNRVWLACRFLPYRPQGASESGGCEGSDSLKLVSTGGNGDLLLWSVGGPRGKGGGGKKAGAAKGKGGGGGPEAMTPSGVGGPKAGGHSRMVFGLCLGRLSGGSTCLDRPLGWGGRLQASGNVHASHAFCMVTVSMDRNIGVWAVSPSAGEGGVAGVSCSLMKMVPTLGGYPYDVECCAMDPYRVAIALGDHTIRVWHTDSAAEPFKSTLLWRYMSWHMVAFSWAVFACFGAAALRGQGR